MTALLDAGYTFPRVAETSVGAVAAAFTAARADSAGLRAVIERLELTRVPDRRRPLPVVGAGLPLLLRGGAYPRDWFRDFLARELEASASGPSPT